MQLEQCQGQSLSLGEGLETSGQGGKLARGRWVETSKKNVAASSCLPGVYKLQPACGPDLPTAHFCSVPQAKNGSYIFQRVVVFFKDPEGIEYAVEVAYDPAKSKTFPIDPLQEKLVVGR